jgi:hypothetical protein
VKTITKIGEIKRFFGMRIIGSGEGKGLGSIQVSEMEL